MMDEVYEMGLMDGEDGVDLMDCLVFENGRNGRISYIP